MAPNISSKLVDKLHYLHWLHNHPRKRPVHAAHGYLSGAAECGTDRDPATARFIHLKVVF